jgi:hypothetical protein
LHTLCPARGRTGLTIADLKILRDGSGDAIEVIVGLLCENAIGHWAALCEWAAYAGYQRIWFDDDVVELEPRAGGCYRTRRPGCAVRLLDGKARLWDYVRRRGVFPTGLAGVRLRSATLVAGHRAHDPQYRRRDEPSHRWRDLTLTASEIPRPA